MAGKYWEVASIEDEGGSWIDAIASDGNGQTHVGDVILIAGQDDAMVNLTVSKDDLLHFAFKAHGITPEKLGEYVGHLLKDEDKRIAHEVYWILTGRWE